MPKVEQDHKTWWDTVSARHTETS